MENNTAQSPSPTPPAKDTPEGKKFVSWGWRIHNELTYRGLNWLLNSTIGVAFAYWTEAAASGRKYFSQPVTGFYKGLLGVITKNEAFLEAGAKWGSRFTSIMAGGFAIIPLVTTMENKKVKKKFVHWMDGIIYGKKAVETDPKFEDSYRRIDEEPEKKFWAGIFTRFVALAPLLVPVFARRPREWLDKKAFNPIAKSFQFVAEKVGIRPVKMSRELVQGDTAGRTKWQYLHYLIAFDFGLTFFYAFLHEIVYKAAAALGIKENKSLDKTPQVVPAPTPAADMPAQFTDEKPFTQKIGVAKVPMQKPAGFIDSVAKSRMENTQQAFS